MNKSNENNKLSVFKSIQSAIKRGDNISKSDSNNNHCDICFEEQLFKIDLNKQEYIAMPIEYYPNSKKTEALEYHSGSYNYLYSKEGYKKLKANINLSEATYKNARDDSKWNGYIIINHKAKDEVDFGLIAINEKSKILFKPFLYYMGGVYPKEFKVFDDITITSMQLISPFVYGDADDIEVTLEMTKQGWEIKYLNLRTSRITTLNTNYNNIHDNETSGRFLVGVSLCPVGEKIWDPLSGAMLKQVTFKSVVLDDKDPLYPGSNSMSLGFSQGGKFAQYSCTGTRFIFSTVYEWKQYS